jgi:hypothetical protein
MTAHGRASVSTTNPRAFGICDRCSFLYNHHELQWQFDYRGAALINIRLLVCETCLDVPQNQLRNIIVPADPTPIMNARVQDYVTAETNYRVTSSQVLAVSAASGNGTTATLTFNISLEVEPIRVGSTIVVSGMEPAGYNGTFIVTASSNTGAFTVSYACRTKGPMALAGSVAININPVTGLPTGVGLTRITQADQKRVTQMTGEPPFGLNEEPGTSIFVPDDIGGNDPGLPYNMDEVPKTGPLT